MRCTCGGLDSTQTATTSSASTAGGSGHPSECGQAVVLQAVHELYDERDLCDARADVGERTEYESTFLFIGYALDDKVLYTALIACSDH